MSEANQIAVSHSISCDDHEAAAEPLIKAARRIIKAGKAGKGCRLSAEETRLLLSYNLPCTADNPE